jgi:putative addiction module component (TIGR02574 family)
MNTLIKELYEHAQQLPLEDQIELADLIYAGTARLDPEWEAAWQAECERRWAEFERGEVEAIDSEVVHDRLKAKYGWS